MARLRQVLRSATRSGEAYCPEAGDIVWIDFDPQAGREQAGRRPALVLSPRAYNRLVRLCVLCPVTTQGKGYPFEVAVPPNGDVSGFVLADQVKSLSWHDRNAQFACAAPTELVAEVKAKIKALLGLA